MVTSPADKGFSRLAVPQVGFPEEAAFPSGLHANALLAEDDGRVSTSRARDFGTDCFIQKLGKIDARAWERFYRGSGNHNEDWYGWLAGRAIAVYLRSYGYTRQPGNQQSRCDGHGASIDHQAEAN